VTTLIVRLEHLSGVRGFSRRAGFCRRGARAWFKRNGLNWDRFRREGIDAQLLSATGDPMALALVEHARECTHGQQ